MKDKFGIDPEVDKMVNRFVSGKLQMKLRIADIQKAVEGRKRVQDIDAVSWSKIVPDIEIVRLDGQLYETELNKAKDWFNKKYANPQPVECDNCERQGTVPLYDEIRPCEKLEILKYVDCPKCDGDGVSHYQAFVYDKKVGLNIFKYIDDKNSKHVISDYENRIWEGKELKIIVDPFVVLDGELNEK